MEVREQVIDDSCKKAGALASTLRHTISLWDGKVIVKEGEVETFVNEASEQECGFIGLIRASMQDSLSYYISASSTCRALHRYCCASRNWQGALSHLFHLDMLASIFRPFSGEPCLFLGGVDQNIFFISSKPFRKITTNTNLQHQRCQTTHRCHVFPKPLASHKRWPSFVPGGWCFLMLYVSAKKSVVSVPSLKPTKMDGWNTIVSSWDGLFSRAKMLVSGRAVQL